jgi:hypothetical protein
MAHFAEINENNIVLQVVVLDNTDILNPEGEEEESIGINLCKEIFNRSNSWVQTSYNGVFRGSFAGEGYEYDNIRDQFIPPQPYPSWSLTEAGRWEAPVSKPLYYTYALWDEASLSWKDPGNPNIGQDGVDYTHVVWAK